MADATTIIGTWRMISWTKTVVATGETTDALGRDPVGYIAYHTDGRMMALVVNSRRGQLKGATPSDQEKIDLFNSMLAYSARYTLKDDELTHHVDVTCNPAWVGDMKRPYKISGDTLVISNAPGEDPITGDKVIYRMEFQKI